MSKATAVIQLANGIMAFSGWSASPNKFLVSNIPINGSWRTTWDYSWTSGLTKAYALAQRSDENVAIVGYYFHSQQRRSDAMLMVKRQTGDTLWTRRFGSDNTDIASGIVTNEDGSMLVCGSTRGFEAPGGFYDFFLAKFNANGDQLWLQHYGDEQDNSCYSIAHAPLGGYYLAGRTVITADSSWPMIMRADSLGNPIWTRNAAEFGWGDLRGITATPGGGLMAAGYAIAPTAKPWIIELDSAGNRLWDWIWDAPQDTLWGIAALRCGRYAVVGSSWQGTYSSAFVACLVPTHGIAGVVRDFVTGEPVPRVLVRAIGEDCLGETTVTGRFAMAPAAPLVDLVISGHCISTDTIRSISVPADTVNELALSTIRPHAYDLPTSLNLLAHNRLEASGELWLHNRGTGDMEYSLFVASSRPSGTWLSFSPPSGVVPAGQSYAVQTVVIADTTDDAVYEFTAEVELRTNSCPDTLLIVPVYVTVLDVEQAAQIPQELSLKALCPNPFNAEAAIEFALPRDGTVELTAYDILGREAIKLASSMMAAGAHTVAWNAAKLPSGLYLLELRFGQEHRYQKALLLK